jgi:hypothetical protein
MRVPHLKEVALLYFAALGDMSSRVVPLVKGVLDQEGVSSEAIC